MTEASLEQNLTAARDEHLVPGREIHMQDMRGHRFCQVGLITGTSQDNAIANIWSTADACDPTPEQFDALDAGAIADENRALGAWLNPVRHWMSDRLDIGEAGDDKTFGDITGTWTGVVGAAALMQATEASPPTTVRMTHSAKQSCNCGAQLPSIMICVGRTDIPSSARFIASSVACRMLIASISS